MARTFIGNIRGPKGDPGESKAIGVEYDNTNSGLQAENVQDAINEIKESIPTKAEDIGADVSGSANTALENAKSYTDTKIGDLINSAPEAMDTLKEVADAIAEHEDVVEALNAAIGNKSDKAEHNLKTYSALGQIGLTVGTETINDIANNLPDASILCINVDSNNAAIYPVQFGMLTVTKLGIARVQFKFEQKQTGKTWIGDWADNNWSDWTEMGATGPQGNDGTKILLEDCTIFPPSTLSGKVNEGDIIIDPNTGDMYEITDDGTDENGVLDGKHVGNIKGASGNRIYAGNNINNFVMSPGDIFINTNTGDMCEITERYQTTIMPPSWGYMINDLGNIKGPKGDAGNITAEDIGLGNVLNDLGLKLDKKIELNNTSVNDVYETGIYKSSSWLDSPFADKDAQGTLIVFNYVGNVSTGWYVQMFISPHYELIKIRKHLVSSYGNWFDIINSYNIKDYALLSTIVSESDVKDFNTYTTTGIYHIKNGGANNPTETHGTLIVEFDVGTPYQLWMPDNQYVVYKRIYTNNTWTDWTKMDAGHADSATKATQDGNGNNISDTYATKGEVLISKTAPRWEDPLSTYTTTGVYHIPYGGQLDNPTTTHGTLFVDGVVGTLYQLWISDAGYAMYKRISYNRGTTWESWSKMDAGKADSAINDGNGRDIAEALGRISGETWGATELYEGDLNDITKLSIYNVNGTTDLNSPVNAWGFVLTFPHNYNSTTHRAQLWLGMTTGLMYWRYLSGSWSEWYQLAHKSAVPTGKGIEFKIVNGKLQYRYDTSVWG